MNFWRSNSSKISFTVEKEFEYQYNECIVPAKQSRPEWFDLQPLHQTDVVNPKFDYEPKKYKSLANTSTIAGCPALKDFYECGYIVKSWSDILITKGDRGETIVQTPSSLNGNCEFLPVSELIPGQNNFFEPIIRLAGKVEISTSKDISLLQTSCLEGYPQIHVFEGYVPTDVYPIGLKFPFAITQDYDEIYIPYGTPILRLIPVKRTVFEREKILVDKLGSSSVSKCPFFKLGKHLQNLGWSYSRNYFK